MEFDVNDHIIILVKLLLPAFEKAMFQGVSGIRKFPVLEQLGSRCQVAGAPEVSEDTLKKTIPGLFQGSIPP